MKHYEIKHRLNGNVLFEGEYNSMRECVEYAVRKKVDLNSANLNSADLSYADLRYAKLRYANLSSANLNSADLRFANLSYADLSYANLSSANLRFAKLRFANLRFANLNSADLSYADLSYAKLFGRTVLTLMMFAGQSGNDQYGYKCYGSVNMDGSVSIYMGCKHHTLGEWQKNFNNNPEDFPKGSMKYQFRRLAYNYLESWVKLEVKRLEGIYKRNPNGSWIVEGGE